MSPVASGRGKGQSVARGSRICNIIATSRTLSAGVSSGSPSLLRRGLAWAEQGVQVLHPRVYPMPLAIARLLTPGRGELGKHVVR
eukprot:5023024-Pyramimonas_sp.AAC.1